MIHKKTLPAKITPRAPQLVATPAPVKAYVFRDGKLVAYQYPIQPLNP